jgi:hypothetical protein
VAIHGFGFQAPWMIEAIEQGAIRLTHAHRVPDSPFRYRAEQTFRLGPGRVRIELAVTHEGTNAMPYGIGLHPWLPRSPETRLQFTATHVFIPDESKLPREPDVVGPALDFTRARRAAEAAPLDACFAGWNGQAVVRWPEENGGVAISADGAFCALHVFVPDDRPVLCVEPVSHVPNVHNRPDWAGPPPLVWLSRSLRGSCRKENTPAEQVEAGATVHLPLDQLEPGDLPLRLAAAPRRRERRPDRGAVLLQPSRKGLKSADPRRSGVGQPGVQRHARRLRVDLRVDPTPAHEGRQPAGQPGNARSRRILLDPRHEGCIRPRQRRRGLDEQPGKLRG